MTDRPRNPDKRMDWIEDAPEADTSAPDLYTVPTVDVAVCGPVAVTTDAVQAVSYFTLIIPVSTSASLSAVLLLPQDPLRQYFYVQPIDAPIILASSLAEAQAAVNLTTDLPTGTYTQTGWSPELHNKSAVYAANSSTSTTCRVSVIVESKGSHAPVKMT